MRRILVLTAASLVVASLMTSSQAAVRERTEMGSYTITRGRIHITFSGTQADWWFGSQSELFRALPGENWLSLELADNSGNPVRGKVELKSGVIADFCSSTKEPIPVMPGQKIWVSAVFGDCDGSQSVVTEGTITATFSK